MHIAFFFLKKKLKAQGMEIYINYNFLFAQESPESLLRSALQGKGYAKTVHLQTPSIALIPSQNTVKQDEELRRVLFTNDHQVRDYNFFNILSPTYLFSVLISIITSLTFLTCLIHRSSYEWKISNWNLNAFSMYSLRDVPVIDSRDFEKYVREFCCVIGNYIWQQSIDHV